MVGDREKEERWDSETEGALIKKAITNSCEKTQQDFYEILSCRHPEII